MENWEEIKLLIENCINKSFKENIPTILAECARQDKETQLNCNAHNLFRRESDVDKYNDMVQNFNKMRKRELIIFGISITAINGLIAVALRKIL